MNGNFGAEAYPLSWPADWPRTPSYRRQGGSFQSTFARARDAVVNEIRRLGGRYVVVSSNIPLRRDGLPYAGQAEPADPGIAVYFQKGDKQMVFACDRFDKTWKNLQAIAKTIEAIRGIERWGASDMLERALSAFEALPAPRSCWEILGLDLNHRSAEYVEASYRRRAKIAHPDAGGSHAAMAELNAARDAALEALK